MLIPIRDENQKRIFPFITILILVVNVGLFIIQIMQGEQAQALLYRFGAIPWEIVHFQELPDLKWEFQSPIPNILTLFTSMFLHGGLLHLIGNMLFLWIFADNVEALTGHTRFIGFYLLCGVVAALSHIAFSPDSKIPMVGASGAISGVLGAYFLRFPRARVHLLFFFIFIVRVFKVPAPVMLGVWFLMQLLSGLGSRGETGSGVAWFAHIGGFIAGMVLILFFEKRRRVLRLR
ncbi:rhomboid family intramembrane serine protease [bacterium]|nr:rhomboid family intramembrane serine protease [bacterium]